MTRKVVKKKASKKVAKKKVSKKVAKKTSRPSKKRLTLSQKIQKNRRDAEKAKGTISRNGQKLFGEGVREIFKKFKDLESFSWTEYTPHWNDGDACEFNVHIDSLAINEECDGDYDEVEGVWSLEKIRDLLMDRENEEARIVREIKEIKESKKDEWRISGLEQDLKSVRTRDIKEVENKWRIKKSITELLEGIEDSVFEDMFGEGKVVVTRAGATVEDYEHD